MTNRTDDDELQTATLRGVLAYCEGYEQDENPYSSGTDEYQAWLTGWRGAAEEEGL